MTGSLNPVYFISTSYFFIEDASDLMDEGVTGVKTTGRKVSYGDLSESVMINFPVSNCHYYYS